MTSLKSRVQEARQTALKQEEQNKKGLEAQFEQEALKFEKSFPDHAEEFEKLVYEQLVSKSYARVNIIDVFNNGNSIISQKMQRKLDLFIKQLLKKIGLVQIGKSEADFGDSIILIVALKTDRNKARREYANHEKQAWYERNPEMRYRAIIYKWSKTDSVIYIIFAIVMISLILFSATQ